MGLHFLSQLLLYREAPIPSRKERLCVPLFRNINLDQLIRTVRATNGPHHSSRVTTCSPRCLGPRANGSACRSPEEGHTPPASHLYPSAPQLGGQLNTIPDCAAGSGPADPALSHRDAQLGQPGTPTLEQAGSVPHGEGSGRLFGPTRWGQPGELGTLQQPDVRGRSGIPAACRVWAQRARTGQPGARLPREPPARQPPGGPSCGGCGPSAGGRPVCARGADARCPQRRA